MADWPLVLLGCGTATFAVLALWATASAAARAEAEAEAAYRRMCESPSKIARRSPNSAKLSCRARRP